jgi:hypothetical protein
MPETTSNRRDLLRQAGDGWMVMKLAPVNINRPISRWPWGYFMKTIWSI